MCKCCSRGKKDVLRLVLAEAALAQGNATSAHAIIRVVAAHWPHSAAVWNVYARVAAALGGLRHNLKSLTPLRQKHPSCLPLALLTAHSHSLSVTSDSYNLFSCYDLLDIGSHTSAVHSATIKPVHGHVFSWHTRLIHSLPMALKHALLTRAACVEYLIYLKPGGSRPFALFVSAQHGSCKGWAV